MADSRPSVRPDPPGVGTVALACFSLLSVAIVAGTSHVLWPWIAFGTIVMAGLTGPIAHARTWDWLFDRKSVSAGVLMGCTLIARDAASDRRIRRGVDERRLRRRHRRVGRNDRFVRAWFWEVTVRHGGRLPAGTRQIDARCVVRTGLTRIDQSGNYRHCVAASKSAYPVGRKPITDRWDRPRRRSNAGLYSPSPLVVCSPADTHVRSRCG